MDYEYTRRVWRALGMPEIDPGTPDFDEVAVETLKSLKQLIDSGLDPEAVIANARVYGQAFARIAEVDARLFRQLYAGDDTITLEGAVEALLQATQLQREYALRRHATLAVRDIVLSTSGAPSSIQAVGFVDLVDFTQLSMDLHAEDLGQLVGRFEEIAIDSCVNSGSRLVKMIGDAVMFVSAEPTRALATARDVVTSVRDDPGLFEARAGLDFGELLAAGGDYYGNPVNTASRITGFARSGTVVASEAFAQKFDDPSLSMHDLGKHVLRGVGPVHLYKLRLPELSTDGVDGGAAAKAGTDSSEQDAHDARLKARRLRRKTVKTALDGRKQARKKA
jgi:adenylate cyclase